MPSSPQDVENELQYALFKDRIAARVLLSNSHKSDPEESAEDLAGDLDDFSTYLATEAWSSLPPSIRAASHAAVPLDVIKSDGTPDLDNLDPTSIALPPLPTSIVDTLISYYYAYDSDDALLFIQTCLRDYLRDACAPPEENIKWKATRKDVDGCEICDRDVPLTYHHLIPRSVHDKALKKGWHEERMLNSVAWLCRPCHSMVHRVASCEDLAKNFYTVEMLLEREDIQKWNGYASRQRWGVRRG